MGDRERLEPETDRHADIQTVGSNGRTDRYNVYRERERERERESQRERTFGQTD